MMLILMLMVTKVRLCLEHTKSKRNIADVNNFVPTLKTTSVQFTGKPQKFGKADVTLGVKIDNDTTIDITDAIDPDYTFEGTLSQEAVTDKGYTLNIPVAAIKTDSKAFNNFTIDASISSLMQQLLINIRSLNVISPSVQEK